MGGYRKAAQINSRSSMNLHDTDTFIIVWSIFANFYTLYMDEILQYMRQ